MDYIYVCVEAWPEPSTSFAKSIWECCVSAGNRTRDPHCRRTLYAKSPSIGVWSCHSGSQLVLLQLPPKLRWGSWLNVIRLRVAYAWRSDRMHVAAWELRITSGSPLCRGLTRAIYILCIEHLRMLRLSGELNPGPPALQANTLCKEPFARCIELPFGISACAATYVYYATRDGFSWREE